MDYFNKAKQAVSGGDSSSSKKNKSSDSMFSKAQGYAEKYHVKDKAVEYAQKRVAKRGEPGYVEKKDKSTVDKAMEAAEDFLAKQGQPKTQHSAAKKDNQAEHLFGEGQHAKKH
ncbi:hypothetical protein PRIC1_011380 [Phytophthora ramorum]|nr:hypothetical protein KRP22_10980 [Phytophthora ramorum]